MYEGNTLKLIPLENGLVELNFDAQGKSVNVFNRQTVAELKEALDILEREKDLKGLLVTSSKSVFIAGADITEFGPAFAQGKESVAALLGTNNQNLNRLESLPFPSIVAINGFALGGGFEACLACDYRVISTSAKVGFPEVGLGILPGWGGTVRAPRIAGFQAAVEWVSGGGQYKADQALAAGLVDAVSDPDGLRAAALNMLSESTDYQQRRVVKTSPLAMESDELQAVADALGEVIQKKAGKHLPAPKVALDAMVKSATKGRDEALDIEFEAFYELSVTPQARALIGNFLADQKLASVAKKFASKVTNPVKLASVLGAGVMGGGIAYQNAVSGVPILMKDINEGALDLGMSEVSRLLQGQVKKGRMTPEKAEKVTSAITPTLAYDGFDQCDIVIEAVVEKESIKRSVLAEVEQHVPNNAVLASNTSSILISSIAQALSRPENFCGMHFFNPVHAMPLVEIIRGDKTSEETVARAVAHVLTMRKKAVVVNDCPGFLVNRVLFPYFAGFNLLMRDGADFRELDKVMEGWGWPMGPAYLLDVVGIDVAVHAADVMAEGFPDRLKLDFKESTHRVYDEGRFGQKNGIGFYRYEDAGKGRKEKVNAPEVDELLSDITADRKSFSEEEVIARLMIPMCTEMARCLEEGIVGSPEEADISLLYGLGFPAFRGGVFRWLDEIGLEAFVAMTDQYKHLGALYVPTQGMLEKLRTGSKYYA